MNPEEKIEFVKNNILEAAYLNPTGMIHVSLHGVTHPANEDWTLLTSSEQRGIVLKLQEEHFVRNVVLDSDGKGVTLELIQKLDGPFVSSEDVARVWVLWNLVVAVFEGYEQSPSLDKQELEKLYSEVIKEIELVIKEGKVGQVKGAYKRPFTSLKTAKLEAQSRFDAKPSKVLDDLLLKIAELSPNHEDIQKARKEYGVLTASVEVTSKPLGNRSDFSKLKRDQALFFLKILADYVYKILETACGGFVIMTDESLNGIYVSMKDDIEKIMSANNLKDDITMPEVPAHLFLVDEMDVWWSEANGRVEMIKFLGDISSAWVRQGSQSFPIHPALTASLEDVDKVINAHRKVKAENWARKEKEIDKRVAATRANLQDAFGQKNVSTVTPDAGESYAIAVRDRAVCVNDYVISKPYAVGKNSRFFEAVLSRPGEAITLDTLPESVKDEVEGRNFIKILNSLGFKGEILKAFFPERNKGRLIFRKVVTKKELLSAGINPSLFEKELRAAHITKT